MMKRLCIICVLVSLALVVACGGGQRRVARTTPTAAPSPRSPSVVAAPTPTTRRQATAAPVVTVPQPTTAPTLTAVPPLHRPITFNDYVPEQKNYVDVVCVVVNFAGNPDRVFDLRTYWDRIFGLSDPIRQLNAYYGENYYGQLELRPFSTPQMGEKGYIEVTLPGVPQDYTFGWLIGLESDKVASLDTDAVQRLVLEIMARVVQKHPEVNYQDKFMLVVMNAIGAEYGRGAAGVIPGDGPESPYDLFIGDVAQADQAKFVDTDYFRLVESDKLVGLVAPQGYTFGDYFRDREEYTQNDQFILGMAMFGTDGPLSCATHDIAHGLRRKSAYADPPEGRSRAIHCLYNLPQQSLWMVGTEEHGMFDRSITVSPYIGWWDPLADHLHPAKREFFTSYPVGSCAFTKLRLGFIPDRCLAVVEGDDAMVALAPLGSPRLPPPGSVAEAMAIRVPLLPGAPALAPVYLLLEYRRRVGSESGEVHPDNFTFEPDFVFGDPRFDPGYNSANPGASTYVNPPTVFVPDEGVLVYLVNENIPEAPGVPYSKWYNFVLALLNPEGNDKRDDLNKAALDAGESMEVDFRTLYPDRGVPIKITVSVTERTAEYATVRVQREDLR